MSLDDRHSKALEPELISDPDQKAHQEAKNGLRQFDKAIELIESSLDPERPFRLRPSAIMGLNRIALDGLSSFAGNYRPADIEIGASKHIPPKAYLVPELVEEMCDHVNNNWDRSPIYLASYVLWRLNWIHAFVDGNGAHGEGYLLRCSLCQTWVSSSRIDYDSRTNIRKQVPILQST
jgi:Fic family protein